MDRRSFFSRAGIGAVGAAAALTPAMALLAKDATPEIEVDPVLAGQYVHDDEHIKVRVDLLDAMGTTVLSQVLECRARSGRLVGYNVLLHPDCRFTNTHDHAIDVVRGLGTLPWFADASWPIRLVGGRIEAGDYATLQWSDRIVVVVHT